MSKILVTGGAGFIGSHLVDALVSEGHEVVILDSLEEQVHKGREPDYLNPAAEFIKGEVSDREMLRKSLDGVEILYHEAAAVGVGQSMYMIEEYMGKNTMATSVLMDLLVNEEHSLKKLVVASSMSIYGEGAYECGEHGILYPPLRPTEQLKSHRWEVMCPDCGKPCKPAPTTEEKPVRPTSIYALSKRDQEELCLITGMSYGLPTVALRYFNVYGPRQSLSNPYTGVAAIFSSNIKNGNPPIIFEDGNQTRDFVSVKDIVQANLLVMNSSKADYQAFNVGSGKPTSILGVAEMLAELYGKNLKPDVQNKYRVGDIRHCYADISKLKKIGYMPSVDIKNGFRELVEWGKTAEAVDESKRAAQELKERNLVE
ncbi:MAG: NAD-dependent epimerase/dehydratase family protein [Candidatus Altiarchaeales archaeon]|nr:NAD-dependent epimerase/dehydratase family protein [Candidatus Altiarchaeales archaeon]MBD3417091.1 NAD-dependent epimerase/dehydratase family protein [Candidatus Altiarchaeales archaeon]